MTRTVFGYEGRPVVAGVDTHKDTHHVAVLAAGTGVALGDLQVPARAAGYQQLRDFVSQFGPVELIGVEGTNSYGAGLTRYLTAQGVNVREVIRPKRAQRRRGKSDPIDAYAAAQQALADPDGLPIAKTGTGPVEQLRVLLAERRSAIKSRVTADRQIDSLLITAPETIRAHWSTLHGKALITALAATRATRTVDALHTTTMTTLRRLARRHRVLTTEIDEIDTEITALVTTIAPTMMATPGYGAITTATLLITAGDNPDRLRTEAAFAALCGASPIPASSGKTNRHRLNRGGNRQANSALHQIATTRLATDTRTKTYAAKLRATGKSTKEIHRCLKRAIAREAWHLLTHPDPPAPVEDLRALRQQLGLTLTQAAHALNSQPSRISDLERGKLLNNPLANAYREFLTAA